MNHTTLQNLSPGNQENIRLGSILLWPRRGSLAGVLAPGFRHFDPDQWVRDNWQEWWQVWHTAQVVGHDRFYGWIMDEVLDGTNENWQKADGSPLWLRFGSCSGDRRIPLDTAIHKSGGRQPRVINWISRPVEQEECDRFIKRYGADGYDALDYPLAVLSRVTRGRFPRIVNRYQYCWARTAKFAAHLGEPWQPYYEMPVMPVLVKEYALRRADK